MTYRTSLPHRSTTQSCLSKGAPPPVTCLNQANGLQARRGQHRWRTRNIVCIAILVTNKLNLLCEPPAYWILSHVWLQVLLKDNTCPPDIDKSAYQQLSTSFYLRSWGRPWNFKRLGQLHSSWCSFSNKDTYCQVTSFMAVEGQLCYRFWSIRVNRFGAVAW